MTPKARSSVSAAGPSFRCAVAATRRTSRFAMAATRQMPSPQHVKRGIYHPKFRDLGLGIGDEVLSLAAWTELRNAGDLVSCPALRSGTGPRPTLNRYSRGGSPVLAESPTLRETREKWQESAGIPGSSHEHDLPQ